LLRQAKKVLAESDGNDADDDNETEEEDPDVEDEECEMNGQRTTSLHHAVCTQCSRMLA
jgi:hypothetical protein